MNSDIREMMLKRCDVLKSIINVLIPSLKGQKMKNLAANLLESNVKDLEKLIELEKTYGK